MSFVIRCMHCMEWTYFEEDPNEVACDSIENLQENLDSTNINCRQPRHICVAPFRAVIYRGTAEDLAKLQVRNSWDTRIHNLYEKPGDVISGYVVLQFCYHKVERYRHIELENLIDTILLRVALRGLSYNMKGIVNIYAAAVHENKDDIISWVPIEPLDDKPTSIIPEGFNPYCNVVRKASFKFLQIMFSYEDWSVEGCEWKTRCETKYGSQQPCILKDWKRCPKLLKKRLIFCPCYISDRKTIDKIRNQWTQHGKVDLVPYRCTPANFHEMAVPIIVHDHLVGVIFHGQLFEDEKVLDKLPRNLSFVSKELKRMKENTESPLRGQMFQNGMRTPEAYRRLIRDLRSLKNEINDLRNQAVVKLKQPENAPSSYIYSLSNNRQEKESFLKECATEISRIVEARYRDRRFRAESFFKREIIHIVRQADNLTSLALNMDKVLSRMADFWAFDKGCILSAQKSEKSKEFSLKFNLVCQYMMQKPLLASFVKQQNALNFTLPTIPKVIGLHPGTQPRSDYERNVLDKVSNIKLPNNTTVGEQIKKQDVIVSIVQCVSFHLLFILIGRNNPLKVSPLRPKNPRKGGFSKLFENFFLDTCTDIAREYHTQAAWLKIQATQKSDPNTIKAEKKSIHENHTAQPSTRRKKSQAD